MPGIVPTYLLRDAYAPYAKDHEDLVGQLALYLTQAKADYLRGCMVSVNWDVEEMEAYKDEIVSKRLLKLVWLPILPQDGGHGLGGWFKGVMDRV